MTEDEAQALIIERFGNAAHAMLQRYVDLLIAGSDQQNLISAATRSAIWARHIADSAQLVTHAEEAGDGVWADLGSGAGLPGMVVACLVQRPVVLVEPRRLRVEFLHQTATALGLSTRVTVLQQRTEMVRLPDRAAIISARAVAALPELLAMAAAMADETTLWLLPKGRNAMVEVATAQRSWHGVFHVEPSITDSESGIVIARKVRRR